jgi:putative Holliday junction resolvase
MRLLGVDYGRRRIGLAKATSEARLAAPWRTLEVRGREDAVRRLVEIIRTEGIEKVVVGLPIPASGEPGPASARVKRFGERIARESGVEVAYQDEYATTAEAEERLRAARARLSSVDAAAAALILQDHLDAEG